VLSPLPKIGKGFGKRLKPLITVRAHWKSGSFSVGITQINTVVRLPIDQNGNNFANCLKFLLYRPIFGGKWLFRTIYPLNFNIFWIFDI
jgi:hypothetical protein